jgi:hypothetical protein
MPTTFAITNQQLRYFSLEKRSGEDKEFSLNRKNLLSGNLVSYKQRQD